jgi:mannose-1-phosphate guanylyltransferase/phosphomannomutase
MKAIIVAGGQGTRLRPLTNTIPKPMVQVGRKPILEHTINLLKRNGISDFIIALCYKPQPVIDYFGDGTRFGVSIIYTFEDPEAPLGTAGAILAAKEYLTETFIVTYADTLRELDIKDMLNLHSKNKATATLNVYKHTGENYKSSITFTDDNVLVNFVELPTSTKLEEGFAWSNGSFYIFEPTVFDHIPENQSIDFARHVFPKLIESGAKIYSYPSAGYFIDIGTHETLEKAEKDIKESKLFL